MKPLTAILLIAQVVLVAAFLVRSDKRLSDFPSFYSATRLWQKGEQPFALPNQCREQIPFRRSECLPYVHPPILLPVLSLLVDGNFVASYWRWVAFLVTVLLVCLIPLYKLTGDVGTALQAILWQPIIASIWLGQDVVVIFAAVVFWLWLLLGGREFVSGVALSLAVIKPHFAIALALPLLFSNRRAFAGFILGSSALTLFSLALIGVSGFRDILKATSIMAQGDGFGVWPQGMSNIAGILARAGISTLWSWPFYVAGVVAICWMWRRHGLSLRSISLALVIVTFTAPHVHPWDSAPLVVPLSIIGGRIAVMISAAILFALMPWRLLHWGCYGVMAVLSLSLLQRSQDQQSTLGANTGRNPFLRLLYRLRALLLALDD